MSVTRAAYLRHVAACALVAGLVTWQSAGAQAVAPEAPAAAAPASGDAAAPSGAPAAVSPAGTPAPASSQEASAATLALTPEQALAEATRALTPRPLSPPADPTAAAAYAVHEKHCARCHQGGRLTVPAPAAAFGNVLRLDELARAPYLVQPGNPDGSRLYQSMLRRLMPSDVAQDGKGAPAPTAQEIAAVRAWITSLTPRPACRDRRPVSQKDITDALRKAASEAGDGASRQRFLSISHLHNGCASFEALAAYRQALVKLVNSLSWKPSPVALVAVDEAQTLYRLDLGDLGWLPEHWERIIRSGHDAAGLSPPVAGEIRKPFGTDFPVARADWLAANLLRAPLYYDVLGLPGTGPEILKILQIDADRSRQEGSVGRVAAKPSRFSLQPSLIERMAGRTGALWLAYHALAHEGAVDPTEAAGSNQAAVPHHATRAMLTLPNGLPAFAIVGQRGDRLDELPPDIARTDAAEHGSVRAAVDCFACHGGGPIRPEPPSPGAQVPLADTFLADATKVSEAHRRLGLVPGGTLDGVEPVVALAAEYSRPLSALRAAAELGVKTGELVQIAADGDKPAAVLARRLFQGLVSRAEMEARGRELVVALGHVPEQAAPAPGTGAKSEADVVALDAGPGLVIYSDKLTYKRGDQLNITVKTTADCHLTVISVDQRGRGTVVFPSDFETNTLVQAGQELKLPGAGAPYTFRLNEAGREHVVALCNEVAASTDGIVHDFERQRFTDLGAYAAYVEQHAGLDPTQAAQAGPATKRPEPRRRGRRRPKTEQAPGQPARPDQIARAAITIVVEP